MVRRHIRGTRSGRLVVGAINHVSAIGVLGAFEESGRTELPEPNIRLDGSVAFSPERYGPDLVRVSLDILNKRTL